MKALFISIVLFIFQVSGLRGQVMWQVSADQIASWYYNGGDEFDANHIDTNMWLSSYPWGRNLYCNQEQQYYSDWKNHELRNGVLRLEARKEPVNGKIVSWESDQAILKCGEIVNGPNIRDFLYSSGMIFSKEKFHFGYYEIRFKSSSGKGLWPAFWLYAGHESDEIDIFELKGERNSDFHVDVHCNNGCKNYRTTLGIIRKNWGTFLNASSAWHEGYNVIGLEWRPGFLKWYLNGEGVAYWKGKFEFPMWIIANLAIPSDGGPFGPGPDASTTFPAAFEIDYIRIWSAGNPTANKKLSGQKFLIPAATGEDNSPQGTAVLAKKKRPEYKRKNLKNETVMVTFTGLPDKQVLITLLGKRQKEFLLEITDGSGKLVYRSDDSSRNEHLLRLTTEGKYHLKMNVQGNQIEHHF